jgi:hypothetical protein
VSSGSNGSAESGSSPPWPPARSLPPGLEAYRLEAASESATGCGYEIVFTLYGLGFPSPDLGMPVWARDSKVTPMDTNISFKSY